MHAWPAPDGPAAARAPGCRCGCYDTATGAGAADRAGPDRADVRLRHHALRRDPHRPRRDLRRVRPGAPRLAATPATTCTTCRTSPTSTTRCSSAPRATARTGATLAERETDAVPRGHGGAAGAAAARRTSARSRRSRGIVDAIGRLREQGAAYDVDGDIYFSVHSDPRFGGVGNLDDETMLALFAERGGDPERAGQEGPARLPALAGRAAGRAVVGDRRPGCRRAGRAGTSSARRSRCEHLGDGFDVQGGGSDLVFPHHEMSASEAQVLTGSWPFARHYVHAGMVGLDGEKMSKSQGQPGLRLGAAPRRRTTRWRSGWRCWPTTTAPTGSGPTTTSSAAEARLARWRDAVDPADRPAGRRRCWPRCAGTWPTTWTPPAALAAVDRWAADAVARGGPTTPRPDAGRAGPSTPSSASASEAVAPVRPRDRLRLASARWRGHLGASGVRYASQTHRRIGVRRSAAEALVGRLGALLGRAATSPRGRGTSRRSARARPGCRGTAGAHAGLGAQLGRVDGVAQVVTRAGR